MDVLQNVLWRIITYESEVPQHLSIHELSAVMDMKKRIAVNEKSLNKTDFTIWLTLINYILLFTGMILSATCAGFSIGSANAVLTFLSQMQLITLIPKIGAYIPSQVTRFITDMNHALFNFGIIVNDYKTFFGIDLYIDYPQPDAYLSLLKIDSGSGIINTQGNI